MPNSFLFNVNHITGGIPRRKCHKSFNCFDYFFKYINSSLEGSSITFVGIHVGKRVPISLLSEAQYSK